VRRAPPRPRRRSGLRYDRILLLLLLAGGAFYLGRLTSPKPVFPPVGETEPSEPEPEPEAQPLLAGALTSTTGLCPCPKPRKRGPKKKPIGKRKSDKVVTAPFERPDPTEATAEYLKRAAKRLAACAPAGGKRLRVHLQVTVAPEGTIDAVSITNLDPIDPDVGACVEKEVRTFTPPPFDATEAETFALTAVL
jgi:hypothetical protein